MTFSGYRKQADATYNLYFSLVDSADSVTPLTGKAASVVVTLAKNGGTAASPVGAITEVDAVGSPGLYQVAGDVTDSDTVGTLLLYAKDAASDAYSATYNIVTWDPFVSPPGTPGAMSLADLRAQFRLLADDRTTPYFWSDTEVDRLINLAYFEASERGLVILDRDSFTITTIADQAEYALDPAIIRIKTPWLVALVSGDDDQPIYSMTSDEIIDWTRWYRFGSDIMYQTVTFGALRYGVTENRVFILAPTPSEVRTIRLEVWRRPKVTLNADTDVPEFLVSYHEKMLSWALHLAFTNADSDTEDKTRADKHEKDFERDFGPPRNAMQRRAQLENKTRRVRPSPF